MTRANQEEQQRRIAARPIALAHADRVLADARCWKPDERERVKARILELASQGRSLWSVCKEEGMPNAVTVIRWREEDPAFEIEYNRARRALAERLAQDIVSLADEARGLDGAGVQAVRVQVDARRWVASRILPHTYGDRMELEHKGAVSVAGLSAALRTVQPRTFDAQGVELVEEEGTGLALCDARQEPCQADAGTDVAVRDVEQETCHPTPGTPENGTPATATTRVTAHSDLKKSPGNSGKSPGISPELKNPRENRKKKRDKPKLVNSLADLL